MVLDFTQVDVFTTRRLEGNQLAVFHSGLGLTTARMQAIAREMNLAETTFLLPARAGGDARVRIFTVREELPFAGHPTLGTAYVVARSRPRQSLIRLEMKAGVIPVAVSRRRGLRYLEMRQKDPVFDAEANRQTTAAALRIRPGDLDARYTPQTVSTGLPFLIVPIASRQVLENLAPDWDLLRRLVRSAGAQFAYHLVTGERQLEARMFMDDFEDPATGSAAGCAAAYLVRYGRVPPEATAVIHQGRLKRRPSRIFVAASREGDRVHNVRVGGHVVEVLEGRLRL